jgi:hypothetical protein
MDISGRPQVSTCIEGLLMTIAEISVAMATYLGGVFRIGCACSLCILLE